MNHDLAHAAARLWGTALQIDRGELDPILAELPEEVAAEVKRLAPDIIRGSVGEVSDA